MHALLLIVPHKDRQATISYCSRTSIIIMKGQTKQPGRKAGAISLSSLFLTCSTPHHRRFVPRVPRIHLQGGRGARRLGYRRPEPGLGQAAASTQRPSPAGRGKQQAPSPSADLASRAPHSWPGQTAELGPAPNFPSPMGRIVGGRNL